VEIESIKFHIKNWMKSLILQYAQSMVDNLKDTNVLKDLLGLNSISSLDNQDEMEIFASTIYTKVN